MKLKKMGFLAAALLSVPFVAHASDLTLIDFETLPNGASIANESEITDQYVSRGVVFGSLPLADATQITTVIDYVPTVSGSRMLGPNGPAPNIGGTLVLIFQAPVFSVGSYFIDDQAPVSVIAFGAHDEIVGVASSDGVLNGFDSWSLSRAGGIFRVELTGGPTDGWGIDDLWYTTAVPEPSALALVGAGICVAGLAVRRNRKAHPAA